MFKSILSRDSRAVTAYTLIDVRHRYKLSALFQYLDHSDLCPVSRMKVAG